MAKIFISYRRIDSQHITDRIYDKLINSFGYANIFKDVDSIAIGKNFMDEIKISLEQTDIFLLIIGKNWVGQEADRSLRINNLDDFVRVELENAIKLELPIIPILVNDASIPTNLPTSIEKITKINALKVRADPDFNNDIVRLLEILPKKNENYYFMFLGASLMILTIYLSLPYIKQNTTDIFPVEPQVKPIVDTNKTNKQINSNKKKDEYYLHGELKREYNYKDDKLINSVEYYKSGNKKYTYNYDKQDKVNGIVYGYYDDNTDTIKSNYYFDNGKSGKYIIYKKDRNISEIGLYVNNKRIPSNSYYPNGNINHENVFKDGKISKEITYHDNGNKLAEVEYDSNEKVIKKTEYSSSGKIKVKKIFEDNREINSEYSKNGKLSVIRYWKGGDLNKREEYYKNGTLKSVYPYIDKGGRHYVSHGIVKHYNLNGKLTSEEEYNYGTKVR